MIFSKPIMQLDIDDIRIFCAERIKEGFNLEYKRDFTGRLEKVICAFANTWGGVILLGVGEDDAGKPKLPIDGIPFQKGLDVRVTSLIVDNIYPPVFCEKNVIQFDANGDDKAIIVIGIPESDMTPHSVDHGRSTYVRTDDRNKPEQRATIGELEWLMDKRKKSVELKERLYSDAINRLERIYEKPSLWSNEKPPLATKPPVPGRATFSAIPLFPHQPLVSSQKLKEICQQKTLEVHDYYSNLGWFPKLSSGAKTTQESIIHYHIHPFDRYELFYYEVNKYGLFLFQEPLLFRKIIATREYYYIRCTHIIARLDQFLEFTMKLYNEINFSGLIEIRLDVDDIFETKMIWDNSTDYEPQYPYLSHDSAFSTRRSVYKDELMLKRLDIVKSITQEVGFTFNFSVQDSSIENYLDEHKRLTLTNANS